MNNIILYLLYTIDKKYIVLNEKNEKNEKMKK